MEQELKEQVELLYKQLGTSFAEAVRIFARQSIQSQGMPFIMQLSSPEHRRTLGLANGNYVIPDDIDDDYKTIQLF